MEETREEVMEIGRRIFRRRAEALQRAHRPLVPSYYTHIKKVGFLTYAVVAYQNKLVPK